jgi:ubiquitin carboxyl-terminal hydrolase 8
MQFRTQLKKMLENIKQVEPCDKEEMLTVYRNFLDNNMKEYTVNASLQYWETYIEKSHSIIRDLFTGTTYISTKCSKCNISSLKFEPYIMLTLAVPTSSEPVSIYECLQNLSKEQRLEGEFKYQCDNCREKNDATQKTYIWESPDILIIHLKRFSSKMYGKHCHTEKISTFIDYPLSDLNLADIYSPHNMKDQKYELYGVVQQYGSLDGGHYVACCKNPMNNKWYSYNDSSVNGIPDDKVKQHVVCKSAYMLYYVKEDKSVVNSKFSMDDVDFDKL